jgi:hypothetical protein
MADMSAPRRRTLVLLAVVAVVVARIALGVFTWSPGWSALTWDDFTRVAIAQEWAAAPFWFNGFVWLPLPVWITGSIYVVAGGWFASSPMALMAIINTTAVIVASAIAAWSAHRVFNDTVGSLATFVVVLFAPWNYFLSLSGLAEPLYFVAVTTATAGLVSWAITGKNTSLAVGSLGVAAAAAMRYEGWWLAGAWIAVIGIDSLLLLRKQPFKLVLRERFGTLLIAAAPLAVPLAWMGVNVANEDSPFYFARESARIFKSAYGGFDGRARRLVYYPISLLRAAPLLLAVEGLVAFMRRRRRGVVLLVAVFATEFVLFYVTSLPSDALGAFPERFLFAFALGLAPLIGGLPGVMREVVPARALKPAAVTLVVIAVAVTVLRIQDRPEEWTHAPDLLALNEQIGVVGATGQIAVVAGPETETDHIPLFVQNGDRLALSVTSDLTAVPGAVGDVWIERSPSRILEFDLNAAPTIGRYRLAGPRADAFRLPPCTGCEGWTWIDEGGHERPLEDSPYLGFQFVTEDPVAGERTAITTTIARSDQERSGSVDLRGLWGHGFNRGRMSIVVTLDDTVVHESDIGDPSRWTRVDFDIPAGSEPHQLSVSVVALPGIEAGWGWGTASGVLVRELVVEPK